MDLDSDVAWQLDIYRYVSLINTETIQVVQHSAIETHYNDKYLRERSFIYRDNGAGNTTSHAKLDLKRQAKKITIYVRNNLKIVGKSFKVYL